MFKRQFLFGMFIVFLFSTAFAFHSEIVIDYYYFESIQSEGFDIVKVHPREGITVIANRDDISLLHTLGVRYEIIHEDLETFYLERINASNRMGAYRTFDEIVI